MRIAFVIVRATYLRAGTALLIGGLVSPEETIIEDAWQIERDYNDIRNIAAKLYGKIEKV